MTNFERKNFEGIPLIGQSELLKIDKMNMIFCSTFYKKMNEVRKKIFRT